MRQRKIADFLKKFSATLSCRTISVRFSRNHRLSASGLTEIRLVKYFSIMKLPIRCNRATLLARAVVSAHMVFALLSSRIGFAQSDWKAEWDKIVRSAEAESQLTLYGCCYEYDRILEGFKKKYPKIKVTTVLGSGNQLGTRILAERRGGKFLADVFSAGANT